MGMLQRIATGVYQVGAGAHAFLIAVDPQYDPAKGRAAGDAGLVLIDTGMDAQARGIGEALLDLRRTPADLRAIVITHLHRDHTGGLATVMRHTGAEVWMHPADAALLCEGRASRGTWHILGLPALPAPRPRRPPIAVEHDVDDGETLPFASLQVVATPGHTAGHIALLLPRDGGVLFTGDAAVGRRGVSAPPFAEDPAETDRSLRKLAALDFAIAAFAHGRPLLADAGARFRERWPAT